MLLWRISRHRDLTGAGGLHASGRWHHAGAPIVYMAETPAGALLEACVHTSANQIPPTYVLLAIAVSERVSTQTLEARLAADWVERVDLTRQLGTVWLRSARSALLRVPSALVPQTFNVLLNPAHPEAKRLTIESSYEYPFDARLKK